MKVLIDYVVEDDDTDFFAETIPQLPSPDGSVTNITQYMAWRRRSLYALFPLTFIMLLETIFVSFPTIDTIVHTFNCRGSDSLYACGGEGNLERFLSHDAAGMIALNIFQVVFKIAVATFRCVAVRIAATRGGDWERSRRLLFLGWVVPFGFAFAKYFLPIEKLFLIDYEQRSKQSVMMPVLSPDPANSKFDLCTAMHVCGSYMDLEYEIMLAMWALIGSFFPTLSLGGPSFGTNADGSPIYPEGYFFHICPGDDELTTCPVFTADDSLDTSCTGKSCTCCEPFSFDDVDGCVRCGLKQPKNINSGVGETWDDVLLTGDLFGIESTFKYPSQKENSQLMIWLGDSGELYMDQMVDLLDHLMKITLYTEPGTVSDAAPRLLLALQQFIQAVVRTKISFQTLSTLAPLALSLIPALQKASYAVKQVFPQDAFAGWIIRAMPLLAVPLHAVFILLIGQIFSDWFICAACVCLLIGMICITIWFDEGTKPTNDAQDIVDDFKKAKKKGLIFNIVAGIFILLAVATNDLISITMPEISLKVDITAEKVLNFIHTMTVFAANFVISKIQVTILGADLMINLIFTLVAHLQDKEMQQPYCDEVAAFEVGMKREWKEGDPQPTGFMFDLFGGGDFDDDKAEDTDIDTNTDKKVAVKINNPIQDGDDDDNETTTE